MEILNNHQMMLYFQRNIQLISKYRFQEQIGDDCNGELKTGWWNGIGEFSE